MSAAASSISIRLTSPHPYRIEWFDDEVDSIRTFDPADQRSMGKLEAMSFRLARRFLADRRRFENAAQHASELLEEQLEKMTDRTAKDKLREEIGAEIEKLRRRPVFYGNL